MAWMNIGDNNATLPTAGGTNGECVVGTSKQSASTILFSKSGETAIRQRETEEITEYRALNEASALAKVGVTDTTAQTAYYATFGEEDHSITVTTGSKTEVSAQRANEALYSPSSAFCISVLRCRSRAISQARRKPRCFRSHCRSVDVDTPCAAANASNVGSGAGSSTVFS